MSISGYVNVFQWNREWFFSRRVKLDSGFNVMAVYEAYLTWTKNRSWLHRHLEVSREVVEETLLILQESQCDSLLELVEAVPRWMFSVPDLLQGFCFVHLRLKKINSPCLGKYHLFRIESFRVDFRCVHRFPTPQGLRSVRHPSKFPPAYRLYPRNNPGKTFFPN